MQILLKNQTSTITNLRYFNEPEVSRLGDVGAKMAPRGKWAILGIADQQGQVGRVGSKRVSLKWVLEPAWAALQDSASPLADVQWAFGPEDCFKT